MKKIIAIALSLLLIGGVYYYSSQTNEQEYPSFYSTYDLDHTNIRSMVATIEDTTNDKRYSASIYSDYIDFRDHKSQEILDISNEQFYLSVAPFENSTHPCGIHSLSGCQGEMINKEFDVVIQDINGNTIVDEKIESYKNGFFGVWLPRGLKGTITVGYEGKSATTTIDTYKDSDTCLTTLQLA